MTIVMQTISKSQLKSQLLEHLRRIETQKEPLVITHLGKPVLKIVLYQSDPDEGLAKLRGTVISYKDPTEPVGLDDWEALK